jgi:hypothetical protein
MLGAVEYPINLVVAEPVSGGNRYIVVTARASRGSGCLALSIE